jgi:iron complex transport system ATP-binding protein
VSLRVENLTFGYYPGHPVLRGLHLDIRAGQITGVFGPNGSGKSTLLRCLNGALRPQTGAVWHDGQRLDTLTPREIAARIAVVPQETPANAPFLAREMVMMGRFARWNLWGQESPEDHRAVHASLERVGALDLANRHFDELSGGERQRVVIARALAQETRVLLLDEPASHLDIAHQLEVFHLARALAGEGYTILMICHDLLIAPMFTDQALLMKAGQVVAAGTPAAVLNGANLVAVFGVGFHLSWPVPGQVTAIVPTAGEATLQTASKTDW